MVLINLNPLDTIIKLTNAINEKAESIRKLESENKRYVEVKTEKEIAESELKKAKQELLDIKIEHNKLKMMYNEDVLDNYEKSLREAHQSIKEAQHENDKLQEFHKDEIQNVLIITLIFRLSKN